jgi:multidrug efflux pump subunit AcrB
MIVEELIIWLAIVSAWGLLLGVGAIVGDAIVAVSQRRRIRK